jgi:lysophospholipase L1-like esterase
MVPEKEFESNLTKLFKQAKKHSNKIAYMGCTPADEEKTAPFWDNIFFRNSRIKLYDTIAKRVCKKSGVHYIELFSKINGNFWDGLHPDTKQHKKIFEILLTHLTKNKWV